MRNAGSNPNTNRDFGAKLLHLYNGVGGLVIFITSNLKYN